MRMSSGKGDTLLAETLRLLGEAVERMPACAYRDLCTWVLTSAGEEARGRWLQVTGVSAILRLYGKMVEGLLTDGEREKLAPFAAAITVQQMYEVVSDNLAIGLAPAAAEDGTAPLRRDVLLGFNRAMIARLGGARQATAALLAPVREATLRISAFDQSLSPQKHEALARSFLQQSDAAAGDLEYMLWPNLIANVEATVALADRVRDHRVGPLVRRGLIGRYAGVSTLLEQPGLDLAERLRTGTDTILVKPTLGYCVGAVAESVRPLKGFAAVVEDGTLQGVLEDAALLTRILNDVGTKLLGLSNDELRGLLDRLETLAQAFRSGTLREVLLASMGELGHLFTRIRKDLVHREFNVCLDQVSEAGSAHDGLAVFGRDLLETARIYRERGRAFTEGLDALSERLGDEVVSRMIQRFVTFHEVLYTHAHDDVRGEFAV